MKNGSRSMHVCAINVGGARAFLTALPQNGPLLSHQSRGSRNAPRAPSQTLERKWPCWVRGDRPKRARGSRLWEVADNPPRTARVPGWLRPVDRIMHVVRTAPTRAGIDVMSDGMRAVPEWLGFGLQVPAQGPADLISFRWLISMVKPCPMSATSASSLPIGIERLSASVQSHTRARQEVYRRPPRRMTAMAPVQTARRSTFPTRPYCRRV
jgi:hypothetical protein